MFSRVCVLACVLATLLLLPAQGAGYLHRDHAQIVDGAGRAVRLRGVNLGNWLYTEPWMSGDGGFGMYAGEDGKPDEMQSAITALVGAARAAAGGQMWRDGYITRADIQQIAGWGFNSVRVPLDYRLFVDPVTGKDADTGFISLDRLLTWCAAAKVYVIPDMHDVPGGKLGWVKGSIYGDTQKQTILAHVWHRIADRYKDNPWVGGYDLVNEPAVWDAPKLSALYKTLVGAVRSVDAHHLLIAEGDAWGSRLDLLGLAGPRDLWDDNLALSLHVYGSALAPSPMAGPEGIAAGLDVPVWMGEFGYNSNTWNRALRDQAEAGGFGWCLWAYKSSGIWSLTGFTPPPSYQRLQDYWNQKKRDPNTPRPSPKEAWQALKTLAQATAVSRCIIHRDVLDALTRPDFTTRAVPYQAGLTIPGRIPAVYYDMGAEGVASHDTVSSDQAGKGPAGEAWNSGWTFRNDGVDLFAHPDPGGLGVDIGGIAPGEWTDYTVTCTPGTDTVQIRYGSPGGGKMHLLLDGADISGPITLPATGGYDRFQTLTLPGVKIRRTGRTTLRCAFDSDGFNLAWLSFRPQAAGKSKRYGLGMPSPYISEGYAFSVLKALLEQGICQTHLE